MRLRIGAPRAALVVAPHPDDEVIGAFGLIRALRRRGTRMSVLVVTDGAGSHRASARWPSARLIRARRLESRRALRRLGIAAGDVHFLALPDGGLSGRAPERAAIARHVARNRRLDLLVGPADDDAHPDHRHVAAALRAVRFAGRRLTYRVWPPAPYPLPGERSLPVDGRAKRSVIRTYRTQLGAITDDPAGFAIAPHELVAFSHAIEHYR